MYLPLIYNAIVIITVPNVIQGETIKLSSEKKTLQLYFKTFIEKINSGNLIML